MFNQWFGGVRTAEKLVRRALPILPEKPVSLLEVAAGNGYLPERVRQRIFPEIDLKVTLLDRSRDHLNGANPAVAADALALPFADNSFHLVSCNLFLHHLGPEDVGRFAREALRVCRTAFLINDVIRDPLHLALSYAGFPLYRSRLTRNDAPASVRQAYTPRELRDLLSSSGAARISISRHYLYRMGIVAWKQPEREA
jgi:ubiquinone/menaquinone biosynthesis C-methylase UbiE